MRNIPRFWLILYQNAIKTPEIQSCTINFSRNAALKNRASGVREVRLWQSNASPLNYYSPPPLIKIPGYGPTKDGIYTISTNNIFKTGEITETYNIQSSRVASLLQDSRCFGCFSFTYLFSTGLWVLMGI